MSMHPWLLARRSLWAAAALMLGGIAPAHAQAVSEGRGQLTLMIGQGSGPLGGIASDVVQQNQSATRSELKHFSFRLVGGYQFAKFFSAEVGVTHMGPFKSHSPYLVYDELTAETSFVAIEANLVGKLPLAAIARIDFTLGAAASGLDTTLVTASGSAVPPGQENPIHSRHLGFTAGADFEVRLGDHSSLIAGYHVYPGVGSSHTVGSANGTMSLIGVGAHFEF